MSKPKKPQVMKPATAAQKLDVYLPATPREFQEGMVSREELDELQRNPPQWLTDLRRNGPHPRSVVAARLRVSHSGLARAGITEALTSEEIAALAADPPEWLTRERETHAEAQREQRRLEGRRDAPEPSPKPTPKVKASAKARTKAKAKPTLGGKLSSRLGSGRGRSGR